MSNIIPPNEFVAVLKDTFARGQQLTFTPSGRSMKPMLDGKSDKVTFSPKPDKLKKYDIAFYQRPDTGQLVLHRVIGFTKDGGYIFSGDNQYWYEYGITDSDILALMTSFTHKGRERSIDSFSYALYCRLMLCRKRVRNFAARVYHKLRPRR